MLSNFKILYIPNGEYLRFIIPWNGYTSHYILPLDKAYGSQTIPVTYTLNYLDSIYADNIIYNDVNSFLKFVCSPLGKMQSFRKYNNLPIEGIIGINSFEIIYD